MEARAIISIPDRHLVLVKPIVGLADQSALFRADLFEQSDKVMLNAIRIDKYKRSSDSNSQRRAEIEIRGLLLTGGLEVPPGPTAQGHIEATAKPR